MTLIDVAAATDSRMVDDDTRSIAMKKIKMSAANGAVMLRGPVEKKMVRTYGILKIIKRAIGVFACGHELENKTQLGTSSLVNHQLAGESRESICLLHRKERGSSRSNR